MTNIFHTPFKRNVENGKLKIKTPSKNNNSDEINLPDHFTL